MKVYQVHNLCQILLNAMYFEMLWKSSNIVWHFGIWEYPFFQNAYDQKTPSRHYYNQKARANNLFWKAFRNAVTDNWFNPIVPCHEFISKPNFAFSAMISLYQQHELLWHLQYTGQCAWKQFSLYLVAVYGIYTPASHFVFRVVQLLCCLSICRLVLPNLNGFDRSKTRLRTVSTVILCCWLYDMWLSSSCWWLLQCK